VYILPYKLLFLRLN